MGWPCKLRHIHHGFRDSDSRSLLNLQTGAPSPPPPPFLQHRTPVGWSPGLRSLQRTLSASSRSDVTSSRKPTLHLPLGLPWAKPSQRPPAPTWPPRFYLSAWVTVPLDPTVSGGAPFPLGLALLCAWLCPVGASWVGRCRPGVRESATAWLSDPKVGTVWTVTCSLIQRAPTMRQL